MTQPQHQVDETNLRLVMNMTGTMFMMEIEPDYHGPKEVGVMVAGETELVGDWTGRVRIHVDRQLAVQYSARLMARAVGQGEFNLEDTDCTDFICEFVNVATGGVKSLLSGSSDFSLPQYLEDVPDVVSADGDKVVASGWFSCDRMPIHVSVTLDA